jgi:hypothetical protein
VWWDDERGTSVKENDDAGGTPTVLCSGYGGGKMETRLSGE